LTKALVELHGGRLELEINQQGGTDAVIRFPADRVLALGRSRQSSASAD